MTEMSSFLAAHPGSWLVLVAIGVLLMLRLLARLACLATLVAAAVVLLGFAVAVANGLM